MLDDGMMCRYGEDPGGTLGCIVEAMAKEAKDTAFCLSTDATGVRIQPKPLAGRKRRACRMGYFLIGLADQEHVFFESSPSTPASRVCEMFRGLSGFIQAAEPSTTRSSPARPAPRTMTRLPWRLVAGAAADGDWEAATVAKDAAAREALLRMDKLFDLEAEWAQLATRAATPAAPARLMVPRRRLLRLGRRGVREGEGTRALVATAFGYAVRQEAALPRFLDDRRFPMTNKHSERALRGKRAVARHGYSSAPTTTPALPPTSFGS